MNKKKILVLIGMIVLFLGVRYFDIDHAISVESLIENKDRLIVFTAKYHLPSIIIFLITNILLGAIGVPVFAVFTLAAGLVFGFLEGMILSTISSVTGGYISFFLSRYVFSSYFHKKYGHRLRRIESKMKDKEFTYLLGLRLMPGFPYFLTNILAGLSKIKTTTFFYSTILGILPSTVLFIYCGHVLREVDSVYQMLTLRYMWPVIAVVWMIITGLIIRFKKSKAI